MSLSLELKVNVLSDDRVNILSLGFEIIVKIVLWFCVPGVAFIVSSS